LKKDFENKRLRESQGFLLDKLKERDILLDYTMKLVEERAIL
jgi:hypothetical protein